VINTDELSKKGDAIKRGTLYLLPVCLGEEALTVALPDSVLARTRALNSFIVEEAKTARAWLKRCEHPQPIQALQISVFNEHSKDSDIPTLLEPLRRGVEVGLFSEAGVPCVADPGGRIVAAAHREGFQVQPLVGPSSLLLALMASGLEGQSFEMVGYLPVDDAARSRAIKALEAEARERQQTKMFIETPYRSQRMLEALLAGLQDGTVLCVARALLQGSQVIKTARVSEWRTAVPELGKEPCVFLIGMGFQARK
jgi:16S rRNA (cytidine1402-2'-O)-methyltransferase